MQRKLDALAMSKNIHVVLFCKLTWCCPSYLESPNHTLHSNIQCIYTFLRHLAFWKLQNESTKSLPTSPGSPGNVPLLRMLKHKLVDLYPVACSFSGFNFELLLINLLLANILTSKDVGFDSRFTWYWLMLQLRYWTKLWAIHGRISSIQGPFEAYIGI